MLDMEVLSRRVLVGILAATMVLLLPIPFLASLIHMVHNLQTIPTSIGSFIVHHPTISPNCPINPIFDFDLTPIQSPTMPADQFFSYFTDVYGDDDDDAGQKGVEHS